MLWAHPHVFFLCNSPENTAPPLDISLALCYRARVQDDPDRFAVLGKKFFVAPHTHHVYNGTRQREQDTKKEETLMTTAAINFVNKFFSLKEENLVERKAYKRFKEAMPSGMDEETLAKAFEAFTGNTPTYNTNTNYYSKYELERMRNKALEMLERLEATPKSFSDLYGAYICGKPYAAPSSANPLRKCFKAMALEGVIGRLTISTCGKAAIYLYYSK